MEFISAPIGYSNLATESHPQACYTSQLLNFTSKKLNEILESERYHISDKTTGLTEDLNDCVIKEDTYHTSTGITEDLNDCVIKEDMK
jgi:hypothetical protein